MQKKSFKYISIFLIIFSFVLLGFGTYISYSSRKSVNKFLNDSYNSEVIVSTIDDNVSLEDKNNSKDNSLSNDEIGSTPEASNKPIVTSNPELVQKPVQKPVDKKPEEVVVPSPKPSSKPVPSPSSKPTPEVSEEPKVEESTPKEEVDNSINNSNEALSKTIEDKYGIEIKYGLETINYKVGGMGVEAISNPMITTKALNDLNSSLEKYPEGFFREMKNNGFPLNVYLIQKYSRSNVTGVTESYRNYTNISVAVDFSFADTFHHETFHYTENYMKNIKNVSYLNWNKFNPADFSYGSINKSLSFDRMFLPNSSFVNDYAQTDECEDRASTFEYMMASSKASCLNKDMPIWKKAVNMSEMIDKYFDTVSPSVTEYWERYL